MALAQPLAEVGLRFTCSGEAEIREEVLRLIRVGDVARLNDVQDIEWGRITYPLDRSPVVVYRNWDEGAAHAVGPIRTISVEDIESIHVY